MPREMLLAGTKFQTLLTIGSRMYYETHYAPLLRMQGFANEIAFEVIRGDARILPVLVNSRQKRDASGAPLVNRITLFDSTDRRRYERELLLARRKAEQVANDKANLLAMLSHDIRNPLNAVMGVVQLLDRSELSDSQRRLVRLLKSSSENMLNLLNHVLELSRAESGSFALVEEPFSLKDVADEWWRPSGLPREKKAWSCARRSMTRCRAFVTGDPVAIRQILSNLVGNAVKFTACGSVTLTIGGHGTGHRCGDGGDRRVGHRHRHRAGCGRSHLQRIHPGELRDRDAVRRQRSGADHHPPAAGVVRELG